MPHINEAGLELIESFEGLRLKAYPDPATGADPWTIGYGDTAHAHPGETITKDQAIEFLREDVRNAENAVIIAVHVTLTPNQFSALVSFEYNTGAPPTAMIFQLVNENRFDEAADEFGKWVYAGGQVMDGLVRRRAAERALFVTPG